MYKKTLIGISLLLIIGLLVGCSGIKQEDLDAANAAKNAAQAQVNTLQTQVNTANAAKTKAEANISIVRQYVAAMNVGFKTGDFNGLDQLLAPDFKQYISAVGTPVDAAGKKKRLAGFRAAAPDLQLTEEKISAEGDLVVIRWTSRGTQVGPFVGLPPTGKTFTGYTQEICRIENGKIIEIWGQPDIFDTLQQLGAAVLPKADLDAANAAKSQADTNIALVQQYVEQVINGHNPNALDDIVATNYKRYPSATATLDLAANKQRMTGLFAAFPDVQATIDEIIAEGDLVMYRSTITGTHQGAFMGIPATGKPFTIAELMVIRIENGKIVEQWGGPDIFSLLQQIGAVISAGQ
jgi:predicted ester cyclase